MENEQIQPADSVDIVGVKVPIEIYDFFKTAGIVLIICTIVYIFIATPNQVEGESMNPSLHSSELIVTDKFDQLLKNFSSSLGLDYSRGDIVVFQKPGHKDFVKRIIGLPGEKVSIRNGQVYINGTLLKEDYIIQSTTGGDFVLNNGTEITIPENRYFVLGDNREDSLDSRYNEIGLINRDWIKGRVFLRYWPMGTFTIFPKSSYNI